jgi:flavin-binding protein dodecin
VRVEGAVALLPRLNGCFHALRNRHLQQGIVRANQTLRNLKSAWVKEQQVRISAGKIVEYQVDMLVTFVLDE